MTKLYISTDYMSEQKKKTPYTFYSIIQLYKKAFNNLESDYFVVKNLKKKKKQNAEKGFLMRRI